MDVTMRGVLGALVAAAVLAGCSGGAEMGSHSAEAGGVSQAEVDDGPLAERPTSAPKDASADRTANRAAVQTRAVIRTGRISVVVKDLEAARDEVDSLLGRHGGYVAEEESFADGRGRLDGARLVLRLPAADFGTAMSELAELGRRVDAHTESEDVTTEVIDVDSRVAVQRASIARLRGFLRQATTVEDMIRLEEELARRQAELESLLAQQAYLADRTALATITVHLSTAPAEADPFEKDDDTGFLAGLRKGWAALTTVLVGLATVAGAALPFTAVLALVAIPLWLLWRQLAGRRTAPPGRQAGG